MPRAAIAIDNWKLPTFKEALDREGLTYEKSAGVTKGTLFLTVETDDVSRLAAIVSAANAKAAASKLH